MGIDFEQRTVRTDRSMKNAFATIRDRDVFERGHSFGGFGTKSDIRLHRHGLYTAAEAENIATQAMMDGIVSEDDPAMALALATERASALHDTEKHSLTDMVMPCGEWVASRDDPEVLRRAAAQALDCPVDRVVSVDIIMPYAKISGWNINESSTSDDDLITRYELVQAASRHPETTVGRYDSLDEAKAALRSFSPEATVYGAAATTPQRMEIRAVLVHENGDPLMQATKTAAEVTLPRVDVVLGTVSAPASVDRSTRSGWLFFGACPA